MLPVSFAQLVPFPSWKLIHQFVGEKIDPKLTFAAPDVHMRRFIGQLSRVDDEGKLSFLCDSWRHAPCII